VAVSVSAPRGSNTQLTTSTPVQAVPLTLNAGADGGAVTEEFAPKIARTLTGEFMVTFWEFGVPVSPPLKPVKG